MSDDPNVFLRPSQSRDITEQMRMFDSKKWLWVPDEEEAFKAACVKSQKGDKMRVELADGSELDVEINSTQQMNPPKFEKVEDMAGLTYLNEASVLHNLRQRYYSSLIYTYSGLFCVAINPYRNLPIYTRKVVDMYRGKRKTEMPPHIFSVADNAYRDMLQDRENQSILITGESGAGKTENTKKVIQYFAVIAPSAHKSQDNLEDQVIQANPVLEAFGNAKTIRNDNSSRFGKFIRIHFGNQGKISGADIEYYLLEKSRVIHQQAGERCYHIFYQLMAGADQEMLNKLLLSRQVKSYQFLANSEVTVDNVDDSQMFKFTVDAMEILGIEKEEQMSMFRTLGGILHFGNIEVKQRPREEWATIPTTTEAEKVGHLLGISSTDLVKALIKPRIRVGNEYVQQGRNLSQVQYSIGALSKSLYERMFRWLVMRVNKTLDTKARKNFFIGVLDIAGFEIFKFNSFEQLCINFTNEKLQQFFNHHMFVLEQEEYRKEGIKWDFIDFGLDLQPCIDLIEKSMGILALLDEECLFPKASDKSFINKLHSNHEGKSPNYVKPQFRTGGNDWDFEIAHYAGTVGYNGTGWLDKNKDPLNESVVELMRKSTDPFIGALWSDYQTEGEKPRGKKGSQFVTMGQMHKTSLNKLMTTLRNTSPNFVRCIIPNEMKRPGVIDAHLVLHQLRCNGVLEGIRICRKGFPNRLLYQEFRQRYAILAPKAIPEGFMDGRKAAEKLISALQLESSEYRLGHSKVFFRAGVLGHLEDLRDQRLAVVLTQFQSYCRGFLMRRQYKKLLDQRIAIAVIQRNIRKHMFLRDWKWWKLYTKVKPLLNVARTEDELRQKEEEINRLKDKVTKEELTRKELEESSTSLMEEKNQLFMQLQREQDACAEAEENCQRLVEKKLILEQELQQMVDRLDEEVENNTNISSLKRKLEAEMDLLNEKVEDVNQQLDLVEQEKAQKEKECIQLDSELDKLNDNLSKSNKEKKGLEERLGEVTNCLQAEEDKANRLSKLKIKLESSVQEASDEIEKQKSARADLDKAKRKTEADLKTSQETVQNLTGSKADLEKTVVSKDKEIGQMQQKGEEDRSQIATLQRRIRELEARIEELEEDLENEKSLRNRTERQKNDLATELEQLQMKLEEEGDIKGAQIDLVRKRDTEINQFRKDYDSQAEEHDKAFSDMKKKHAAAIGEMEEQLEALQKAKAKLEKERSVSNSENTELQSHLDDFRKSKANADKKLKAMEEQLAESSSKNQEMEATIGSLTSERNKAQSESSDLSQQLGDAESKGGSLTKAKQALTSQVDDLKSELESETSAKLDAQSKLRQANAEIAQLQESLDEEQESKEALQRQLTASKNETTQLKSSLDTKDARVEELEEAKRKLQNQMKDCEEEIANAKSKFSNLEKTNRRIAAEVEDLTLNLEKMQTHTADLEKKQKKNDQLIAEWKEKHDGVVAERDSAMAEARNQSTEVLKLRNACEGLEDKLESVKKEKRNLDKEMEDLKRQLDEGGLSSHELEKAKAALEREKEELQESLEEAESEVEAEQAKVLRLQLELSQLRQDIERRLSEKDDENEAMRKNHQRQLEALQQSLDEETKAKNDNARMRKQAEAQCNELQGSIEAKDKAISDMTKKQRILQNQIKELNSMLEDEQRQRDEQRELASKAEKRANDFQLELEELRAKQEKMERTIRTLEGEKEDNEEKIGELTSSVTSLQGAKKRAEQSLASKVEEFEDMESELKETSDKCMKAVEQNNKLQSEVLSQKERIGTLEKSKTSLDHQVRDLTNRLDEEVENAKKNAKREIAKLQARIQELEVEVEAETKTKSDVQRSLKRTERRNKESQMLLEEEKSNSQRMQDQVNSLNTKVRNLRRDKEEAEGEVETMRNKMRQLRSSLEESEDRISDLETQVAKARAGARKTKVVSPMDSDEEK